MNSVLTDETMVVTLRVQDLREIVRDVVAEALKVKAQTDLLDMKQVLERYGIGLDAILAGAKQPMVSATRASDSLTDADRIRRGPRPQMGTAVQMLSPLSHGKATLQVTRAI